MKRKASALTALLCVFAVPATLGCYYAHLAAGQTRVLLARRNIEQVLADPETSPDLRRQLELVGEVRRFASKLGLDVGGQYTSYVAWPGDRIVTTVVATEPGRIEAAGFDFPIVGRVPYKGFFDREQAEQQAEELKADGFDVCVVPVSAYSTLGWLDDPVTQPMLRRSDAELVETVLHELVHATVFVKSQPDFNEGAANFFGEEAAVRFFAKRDAAAASEHRTRVDDGRALASELAQLRSEIAALYEANPEELASERQRIEHEGRARIAALPLAMANPQQVADNLHLNDACLALRGTYTGDTGRHEQLFADLSGDLSAYLERLRAASDRDDPRAAFFAD